MSLNVLHGGGAGGGGGFFDISGGIGLLCFFILSSNHRYLCVDGKPVFNVLNGIQLPSATIALE